MRSVLKLPTKAVAALAIGLLLAACDQAPGPTETTTSNAPTLERAVADYWAAIAARDWYTSYKSERFIDGNGDAVEKLEPEYHAVMNERAAKLKSYEILKTQELKGDDGFLAGKARIRMRLPSNFQMASVDVERTVTEVWIYDDGAWWRQNVVGQNGEKGLRALLTVKSTPEFYGELMTEEDKPELRFIPGPGVRTGVDHQEMPATESADQPAQAGVKESDS